MATAEKHRERKFNIQIDRNHYTVTENELTGSGLRALSSTPIPQDRDLYEVRPGKEDKLVSADMVVEMRDGLRFFTAPGRINPGAAQSC